jgi:hypothetical protein
MNQMNAEELKQLQEDVYQINDRLAFEPYMADTTREQLEYRRAENLAHIEEILQILEQS